MRHKNTKWIALGVFALLLMAASIVAMFLFIMNLMKGDAYQLSLQTLSSNEAVIAQIGKPIRPGYFVLGSIKTNGPDGSAALEYSVEGTRGEARVYAYATRRAGLWTLDDLVVSVDETGQRIVLLGAKE